MMLVRVRAFVLAHGRNSWLVALRSGNGDPVTIPGQGERRNKPSGRAGGIPCGGDQVGRIAALTVGAREGKIKV